MPRRAPLLPGLPSTPWDPGHSKGGGHRCDHPCLQSQCPGRKEGPTKPPFWPWALQPNTPPLCTAAPPRWPGLSAGSGPLFPPTHNVLLALSGARRAVLWEPARDPGGPGALGPSQFSLRPPQPTLGRVPSLLAWRSGGEVEPLPVPRGRAGRGRMPVRGVCVHVHECEEGAAGAPSPPCPLCLPAAPPSLPRKQAANMMRTVRRGPRDELGFGHGPSPSSRRLL